MKKDTQFNEWFLKEFGTLPLTKSAENAYLKKANNLSIEVAKASYELTRNDRIKELYSACLRAKQFKLSKD